MGKAVLIMVLGSIAIFGILNLSINSGLTRDRDNSVDNYSNMQLRNICNSTAEILLARLGDNYGYRVSTTATINLLGGAATYTVLDAVVNGDSLVKLSITAKYGKKYRTSDADAELLAKTINVYVKRRFPNTFPNIPGAIAARSNVEAAGGFIIDGRDHDLNGNLIVKMGTYGLWTTGTGNVQGASKVGGTASLIDYVPQKPPNPAIIKENQVWPGTFPTTPDQVLGGVAYGLPDGTLKMIAQSGVGGSQYTTNPATLVQPLKGITYVELPVGTEWKGPDLNGTGLLIVHNNALTAALKNVNAGTFKGLIIGNDVVHILSSIYGAIFLLTPTPSEGNCIGLGTGELLYSRKAVQDAVNFIAPYIFDYGFAKHRLVVKYWYE